MRSHSTERDVVNQKQKIYSQVLLPSLYFSYLLLRSSLSPPHSLWRLSLETMAAAVGLLSLGTLPQKPLKTVSSELPTRHNSTKTNRITTINNNSKPFPQTTIQSLAPLTAFALPFLLQPQDALAVDGEFGILEGRTVALIHPIVLGSLFFYTLYAGYLGWQWRRVRTIQNEITELKKQVKPAQEPVAEGISPPVSPVEAQIQQLTEERKELLKGSFKDRHYNAGSILLGFGVFEAVGGAVNTWMRTGQLFPGPHLFAGAGITVLWALAAALVPQMQKGNELARNLHIALNALNVLLFASQIPTGFDIVLKVFEFTEWP